MGRSVAVLDQNVVAGGTTRHSSAKITSQHGLVYEMLRLTHGRGTAHAYAAAMESAKERIAELAGEGIEVHEGAPCRVQTERGALLADEVVVATLMPFLDRGGFFARATPSYIVTARIADAPPT